MKIQGIKEEDIKAFVECAEKLDSIMKRIQEYRSDAMLFANQESLVLVSSNVRDSYGGVDRKYAVESISICGMDSGAF